MEYSDVPAGFCDSDWNYEYEMIDYGYEMLTGSTYQDMHYSYLYDESGIIVGMLDANGEQVVKYEYDTYGLPINAYSYENGMWVENDNSSFLTDINPFLEEWDEGIQPYSDTDVINNMANDWAESLLSNSSYEKAITNYSSNWYASLSDVEVLARAIYCEGGTVYTNEEDAVAFNLFGVFIIDKYRHNKMEKYCGKYN